MKSGRCHLTPQHFLRGTRSTGSETGLSGGGAGQTGLVTGPSGPNRSWDRVLTGADLSSRIGGRSTARSTGRATGSGRSKPEDRPGQHRTKGPAILELARCAPVLGPVGTGPPGATAGQTGAGTGPPGATAGPTGARTGRLLISPSSFLSKWGVSLFLLVPLIHHYTYLANTWE